MKKSGLLLVIAIALTSVALSSSTTAQSGKGKAAAATKPTKTVTGCLARGNEESEFSITEKGKTYGVHSSKIDLAKHLGHKIAVTGTFQRESEEEGEEGKT